VSGSVSVYDTVDVNGHAAQVSTVQGSLGGQNGAGGLAGVQLGASNSTVPTTPQTSHGPVSDPTTTWSGAWGYGISLDSSMSGTKTLTVGYGAGGGKRITLPSAAWGSFVWIGSIPYCGGGK